MTDMVSEEKMNELERIVVNIVNRNKLRLMSDIEKLAQKHYNIKGYPNNHQVRYIMKKAGIKMDGKLGFFVVTDDTIEVASRVCMRCDKNKALKNFHRIVRHPVHDGYLLICRACVKEESQYTFETETEIKGVYAYMEEMYRHCIDKTMYERFWEKAYS